MGDEFKDLKDEEKGGTAEDKSNNWIMALVLIVVGIGLLVSNFTEFSLNNWWALFLLIPAITMLRNVWVDHQTNGRLTSRSTGALIGGLTVLAAMAVFLLNLSWSGLWPLGFIFGGISVLLSSRR
ncbi:MAG: hypothetical protein HND44_17340 [Chloroflexi bacterium]|nr:hypothetical protein [Ardenticatenaceae bacterium]MBL1130218.1 hypothetical protein [Chloroflexota bacterium]NOG36309.1 hypothetical protein [Chloroflexota bacterium]GIK58359.1 MAG: hypothetical protein BroJett015_40220 [Chloroflexota bacterium]